jgi:pyruvate dehydrogenase E2 component (dihydrolipoamide acetyltransferase)
MSAMPPPRVCAYVGAAPLRATAFRGGCVRGCARAAPRAAPAVLRRARRAAMRPPVSAQIVDEAKLLDVRAKEVFMPALSSTMTEGVVVAWLKQPGDRIEVGDMIMTVESDKADMDVESFESGYLATTLVEEGGIAAVGATVALIAETVADIASVADCGLDCIVSGSGNRHDGTTAVDNPEAGVAVAAAVEVPAVPAVPAASVAAVAKPAGVKEIFMPALSSTMESGKIDAYYVEVGDHVESGDIVMAVESDKASMDVETFDDGFVAHIAIDVGEVGNVGDPCAFLAATEADIPAVQAWAAAQSSAGGAAAAPAATAAPPPTAAGAAPSPVVAVASAPVVNSGRIVASPYAKKRAKELAVDLSRVVGTGPNGRIVEEDVAAAAVTSAAAMTSAAALTSAAPAKRADGKVVATPDAKKIAKKEKIDLATVTGSGNFGRITADDVLKAAGKAPVAAAAALAPAPAASKAKAKTVAAPVPEGAVTMTAMQKAVVANMNASLGVPVFRVAYSIKTAAFDELYAKLKPKGVTVSALLAKACALTLLKHPIMNAAYQSDAIVYRPQINVAMAVSTPDGSLMTPVLKDAAETDLYSLSRTWKDLVKRTMSKSLKADEYNSGTFFISNLGMFGVEAFDAILPPGAPSILAVAAAKPVVALQKNGLVGVHKEMTVNITCDHRHIYGAQAAEFLKDLADLIENDVESLVM